MVAADQEEQIPASHRPQFASWILYIFQTPLPCTSPEKHKLGFKANCDPLMGETSRSNGLDWYTPALEPSSTRSICLSPNSSYPQLHEHPLPSTALTSENQSEARHRLANSISSMLRKTNALGQGWGSLHPSIVSCPRRLPHRAVLTCGVITFPWAWRAEARPPAWLQQRNAQRTRAAGPARTRSRAGGGRRLFFVRSRLN